MPGLRAHDAGLWPHRLRSALSTLTLPFLLVYGVSYFFPEFGPNVTTFVYPAEMFPVMIRTTGHGIVVALGKCGAFLGVFIFPYLLSTLHLSGAMGFAAIVSILGMLRMDSQTNMRTGGNISSFSPRTCIG